MIVRGRSQGRDDVLAVVNYTRKGEKRIEDAREIARIHRFSHSLARKILRFGGAFEYKSHIILRIWAETRWRWKIILKKLWSKKKRDRQKHIYIGRKRSTNLQPAAQHPVSSALHVLSLSSLAHTYYFTAECQFEPLYIPRGALLRAQYVYTARCASPMPAARETNNCRRY